MYLPKIIHRLLGVSPYFTLLDIPYEWADVRAYTGPLTAAHLLACAKLVDAAMVDRLPLSIKKQTTWQNPASIINIEQLYALLRGIVIHIGTCASAGNHPFPPALVADPVQTIVSLDSFLATNADQVVYLKGSMPALIGMLTKLESNISYITDEQFKTYIRHRTHPIFLAIYNFIYYALEVSHE